MVIGASWAGARAMTSTSGPGISLMGEFTGLGYYAEVPAVIFDIQRVGPVHRAARRAPRRATSCRPPCSRTATRGTRCCCRRRCTSATRWRIDAFDLAERLQTPVFVMSDLDLGMNIWMSEPFPYPTEAARSRQGARPGDADAARRMGPLQGRGRRRHPVAHAAGHRHARVLHARIGPQREGPVQRARRRLPAQPGPAGPEVRDGARRWCRRPRSTRSADARIGIIAFGTSHWAIVESARPAARRSRARRRRTCG